MNDKVKKIYDYVAKKEDFYYNQLTGGEDIAKDMTNSLIAGCYQNIRYFIEIMEEDDEI